jgi:hypothetical protein
MTRLGLALCALALVAPLAACRTRSIQGQLADVSELPRGEHATGSGAPPVNAAHAAWPVDDSPVVARSGTAVVRASRLLLAGQFQAWLDQWAPPDRAVEQWYRSDARVRALLGSELEYAVLAEQVASLGIVVTEADVDAQIARVEPLARVAALAPAERDAAFREFAPLTWEIARSFAFERARLVAWIDQHVVLPPDDVLRDEWVRANDRVAIDVVVVPNQHADFEIERFVDANRPRIEAEYAANLGRFTLPATVTIDELSVAHDLPADELRARCAEVADVAMRVLVGDDEPPAGFVRQTRAVQRQEMPEAFELEPGGLSDLVDRDGLCARFVVRDRSPRLQRLLDDEIVRELGAEMLARESQDPASERLARSVQAALGDPTALAALGFSVTRTPPFARNNAGHVAGVGNVPALHDAIFAMLREPGDTLPGPWFTPAGWVALRLVERTTAQPADFAAARDDFANEWRDILRHTLWPRFLEGRAAANPAEFDVAGARAWVLPFFESAAPEGSQ